MAGRSRQCRAPLLRLALRRLSGVADRGASGAVNFLPTTPARKSAGLFRVPQLIGVLAALASVVILAAAVVAPDIFDESGSRRPDVDIAGIQLTAVYEASNSPPTGEFSLSDLAPTAA